MKDSIASYLKQSKKNLLMELFAAFFIIAGYSYYIYKSNEIFIKVASVILIISALYISYRILLNHSSRVDIIGRKSSIRECLQRDLQEAKSSLWWYVAPLFSGFLVLSISELNTYISQMGYLGPLLTFMIFWSVIIGSVLIFNRKRILQIQDKIQSLA